MDGEAAGEREIRVDPALLEHRRHSPLRLQGPQEMASLPIPDELLVDIFLRLSDPADLVRASAGCVSFRRIAADRSFLRLYRKLHAPPLVGFLEQPKVFHPAIAANPSSSAASSVAKAGDFTFSFLPAPVSDWVTRDVRDGRVLLERRKRVQSSTVVVFPEVVVCDPLHRRYLLLPPIPEDLAASVEDPFLTQKKIQLGVKIFLVPTGDGEEAATADETSFRVIRMAQCKTRLVTFVFSSNTGQWGPVLSRRWSDLSAGFTQLTAKNRFSSHDYAYGSFYSMTFDSEESKLLVLDIKTMEFSIAKPPPKPDTCYDFAMVEAGEGRPGMLVLAESGLELSYFIRQNDGGSSSQWLKVKTISLDSLAYFICNMEKYPLLHLQQGCFTLDIKTFQLEKVYTLGFSSHNLHAYSNFPPSLLSSPTISSGVEKSHVKEMLEQGSAASSSAQSPRPE